MPSLSMAPVRSRIYAGLMTILSTPISMPRYHGPPPPMELSPESKNDIFISDPVPSSPGPRRSR